MFEVDVYLRVRRVVVVEGKSIREASRVFGLHRHAVRKMLAYSLPSGCRRQDLPDRDDCFVKACPAETTEAFLDGHVLASAFLGGVPQTILYDNTKLAVAKTPGDGRRKRTWNKPSFSPNACMRTGSTGPARATTRGSWRGWWA